VDIRPEIWSRGIELIIGLEVFIELHGYTSYSGLMDIRDIYDI